MRRSEPTALRFEAVDSDGIFGKIELPAKQRTLRSLRVKIGGGASPIETSEGWLMFYHGVSSTCSGFVYSIGGAILDIDEPSKVKYRCSTFLLTPEEWYEQTSFVPNVCFPCSTIADPATGRIAVYYGAADTYVAVAFTELDRIVDYIKEHSELHDSDTEPGRK